MDLRKNIMMIVSLMVAVIVALSVLVPVIQDTSASEDTFTNEGYYTMDKTDDTTSKTIVWTKAEPTKITIDGTDFDMSFAGTNMSYTLIGSENLIVRYQKDSTVTGIQAFSGGSTYTSMHTGSSEDLGDTITLTIDNGAVTFATNGTTPINKDLGSIGNDCYSINGFGTGDYSFIMKKANTPAYVLDDSEIKFLGVSVATGGPTGIALYGTGTIADGITVSTVYKPNTITTVSYSDPVATYTEVNGYVDDLYKLDKYNFTITYDASTYDATYSYFIVPAEVTAERSVHVSTVEASLLGIIPLLVIIGIVIGTVWFIRQKN